MKTTITTPDGLTTQIVSRRSPSKRTIRRTSKPRKPRQEPPQRLRVVQLMLPW